ncbi:MAG: PIN domain-containing protein [Nitrospirae bacterium]|nr:PIN domain-containing protein [Nitrospirota bacterium]
MEEKSKGILADTSVWIEFFKLESPTGKRLESLIIKNSVWTCGIVLFELLQGVRSETEKKQIAEALSGMEYLEMSRPLWKKSADLSASLKRKGVTLPLSDIFIASIAIEHNLSVFTLDKHFEQIPGVKIYKV